MAATPLLSVLIPAYNAEQFIAEAIESVLHDGVTDIEVVVVDDGSTDGTVQVVESIRHPALKLARQPKNLGIGPTRQHGISLARGQYVALLDADDITLPGRFAAQLARLEAKDGPDIIGGGVEYFGDEEKILHGFAGDAEIKTIIMFNSPLFNPTVCMRLAPFRDGRLVYGTGSGWEDYTLWVDALLAGLKFENLPAVVTRYRQHGKSVMKTSLDLILMHTLALRKKVAAAYFPSFDPAGIETLVATISSTLPVDARWTDGLHALSRAARLAPGIPGIDAALMLRVLEGILVKLIRRALAARVADYNMLEELTETDADFEHWRSLAGGALDMKIIALCNEA